MTDAKMFFKNKIASGINLLNRYMHEKLNVGGYTELTEDEKRTHDQWNAILTKEANTQDLVAFLHKQIAALGKDLREAVQSGAERKAIYIAARVENYEAIVAVLTEPERNRDALIAQITNLLNTPTHGN